MKLKVFLLSSDLCNAATKIQASFRGHQARKQTQAEKDKEQQDKVHYLHIKTLKKL
jgi:hypothetical protein